MSCCNIRVTLRSHVNEYAADEMDEEEKLKYFEQFNKECLFEISEWENGHKSEFHSDEGSGVQLDQRHSLLCDCNGSKDFIKILTSGL